MKIKYSVCKKLCLAILLSGLAITTTAYAKTTTITRWINYYGDQPLELIPVVKKGEIEIQGCGKFTPDTTAKKCLIAKGTTQLNYIPKDVSSLEWFLIGTNAKGDFILRNPAGERTEDYLMSYEAEYFAGTSAQIYSLVTLQNQGTNLLINSPDGGSLRICKKNQCLSH